MSKLTTVTASVSIIVTIPMRRLGTRMHPHLRPDIAARCRSRQRLLPSRPRPSPSRALNRLPARFLLGSLNLSGLNRGRRRLVLPSRRRDMSRLLHRAILRLRLRLPRPRRDRTRLQSSQHRLRRSLGIPCRFRRSAGSTHHGARLSGQQCAIARRLGIPCRYPCRCLGSTSAGRARTFLRTRVYPVLGSTAPVAMRRQTLIHFLLPSRSTSIMR